MLVDCTGPAGIPTLSDVAVLSSSGPWHLFYQTGGD